MTSTVTIELLISDPFEITTHEGPTTITARFAVDDLLADGTARSLSVEAATEHLGDV